MRSTLHAFMVAIVMGASLFVIACSGDGDAVDRPGRSGAVARPAVPVVVEPVRFSERSTRLEAVGTARARQSVSLFPEAAGEVVELSFQPGDRVEQGAVLLALDPRDERLALELAELRLADAQRTLNRYNTVNDSVELSVPETTIDAARTAFSSARIERDRASVALQRRFVLAPFDGYVGITDLDVGDRITPTTEITTIDDRSELLVSFAVPEAYVSQLNTGDPVRIEAWTAGQAEASGRIVDLGSRVDPVSRAFTARAAVPNADDQFRPGMSFRVELRLTGKAYAQVPEVAMQWGAQGAFIWVVKDGQAQRVAARLIQRRQGSVLVEAQVNAGDLVVGEGVQSMRDGIAVRPLNAETLARDARAALAPEQGEG